jgi:hypothetical protein
MRREPREQVLWIKTKRETGSQEAARRRAQKKATERRARAQKPTPQVLEIRFQELEKFKREIEWQEELDLEGPRVKQKS